MGERTESQQRHLRYMLDRLGEANRPPYGSWLQRWIPGVCKHYDVRCTHGDEIIHLRFRRQVCLVCGRSLDGPLPKVCFFTGDPHRPNQNRNQNQNQDRKDIHK